MESIFFKILEKKNIPTELLYFHIIPYVPFANMTNDILKLQQKKLKLYKYVKKYLLLEDDAILYDILKNYQGESNYYYQEIGRAHV